MTLDLDPRNTARLTISCPDRKGIVAAVSQFLHTHGANIIHSDQHSTDPQGGQFFMRMEFHLDGLDLAREPFERAFAEGVAGPFEMNWRVWYAAQPKRMGIMAQQIRPLLSRSAGSQAPGRTRRGDSAGDQ